MRQYRFILEWLSPTVLIFTLMAMLIATPYLVFATESDDAYMYFGKGQSLAQQDRHQYESNCSAIGQTGVETSETLAQAAVSAPVAATPYHRPRRHIAGGAARGAALGAVGGAITGDPGKGAAAGAALGGTAGAFRRRDQRRQQPIQQQPMQPQ